LCLGSEGREVSSFRLCGEGGWSCPSGVRRPTSTRGCEIVMMLSTEAEEEMRRTDGSLISFRASQGLVLPGAASGPGCRHRGVEGASVDDAWSHDSVAPSVRRSVA